MEDKKIPIFGQYLRINETAETIKTKNPIELKLIKQFSDELNSKPDNWKLKKDFEEISKKMVAMGIKPKMALNSFLIYKYSTIEEGLELLYKNQDGKYNHRFIESDERICFICDEEEKSHRSIYNILSNTGFNINKAIEEDESLKQKINQKEIFLRKTSSKEIKRPEESLEKETIFDIKTDLGLGYKSNLKLNEENNECPICLLEIEKNKFFHLICFHKFCVECVQEYLNEEIKNSRVSSIKCPQKNCSSVFDEKIIKEIVGEEVFYKFKKFKLRDKYKNLPNILCCPITNCEGYASKDEEINHINSIEVLIESNQINNNESKLIREPTNENLNSDSVLKIK